MDGGPAVTVDGYSAQWVKQQVLFQRTGLSPGKHTITITVTSGKNPSSAGTNVDIDAFLTSGS